MIKKQIAIYCRTSRDDKDDPRLSTDSQRKDCIAEANILGFTVNPKHVYIELDRSGSLPPTRWLEGKKPNAHNHRPLLDKMMGAIEKHEVQAVIVRKRDRLFRSLEQSLEFFQFLDSHGIELYGTDEKIRHDGTASSKLELRMMMTVSEYLLDTTKENIRQAKRQQKLNGLKMCGCMTLGYRDGKTRGSVEVVPEAEAVVLEVFDKYISGQSRGEIMRWLNQNHLDLLPSRNKRYKAKQWYHSHVARILSNYHYIGMQLGADGLPIPSKAYPQIIAPTIWYKAQECRKVRRNVKHGKKFVKHILSGFLRCGYDKHGMIIYSRYHKKLSTCVGHEWKCPLHHSKQNHPATIREFIWDDFILSEYGVPQARQPQEQSVEVTDLRIQRDAIRKNLKSLDKSYSNAGLSFDQYSELRRELVANENKLSKQIAAVEAQAEVDEIDWTGWEDLSYDDKRRVLAGQVDHIDVFYDHIVAIAPDGERTIYPISKRHFSRYKSQRPFNCILPRSFDGWACKVEWGYRVNGHGG